MQFARPASGFLLIERPLATAALETALPQCPWLRAAYANVKERLKMAGHKVGYAVKGDITRRVFVEADPETGVTRLTVAYEVFGETVTIYSAKVVV
jgi:hypothetical protein